MSLLQFRQSNNVGQTYGVSVGFSGVDLLLISLWLHGVENPRFVTIHLQDLFDMLHLFGLILLL